MRSYQERMIGAAQLRAEVLQEVRDDPAANRQAMMVFAGAGLSLGIGYSGSNLFSLFDAVLFNWFVFLSVGVGAGLAGLQLGRLAWDRDRLSATARTLAFSLAPFWLGILAVFPIPKVMVLLPLLIWTAIAFGHAFRIAFAIRPTEPLVSAGIMIVVFTVAAAILYKSIFTSSLGLLLLLAVIFVLLIHKPLLESGFGDSSTPLSRRVKSQFRELRKLWETKGLDIQLRDLDQCLRFRPQPSRHESSSPAEKSPGIPVVPEESKLADEEIEPQSPSPAVEAAVAAPSQEPSNAADLISSRTRLLNVLKAREAQLRAASSEPVAPQSARSESPKEELTDFAPEGEMPILEPEIPVELEATPPGAAESQKAPAELEETLSSDVEPQAAAKLEETPPGIPEPEPKSESPPATVELEALCEDIFDPRVVGYRAAQIFDEKYKGKPVCWSGKFNRKEAYSYDVVFGAEGGVKLYFMVYEIKLDYGTHPIEAVLSLAKEEWEKLALQSGDVAEFKGVLIQCEPYLRRLMIAEAEMV